MKRNIFLLLVLLLIILSFTLLTGCLGKMSRPPEIIVSSGGEEIYHVIGLNKWNGAVYDREDTFIQIIKDKKDIPYLKLGSEIKIEFKGKQPDSYELLDYILNKDGTVRYSNKEIRTVAIELKNKRGAFLLEQNYAALLSSLGSDYEPGASLRGFRLNCKWRGNTCEYAFIIRSDAR